MSRANRHRQAREIMRKREAEAAAKGETVRTALHPVLVTLTLGTTGFMALFWVLLYDLVTGAPDTSLGGNPIVNIAATGVTGLFCPVMWGALLTEVLPPESSWQHPVRAFAKGLAYVASPDDAAWREEWPGLLTRRPGEPRRPVRTAFIVAGWVWAAVRSRMGWLLDICLQSDTVCGFAVFGATGTATWAAWEAAGSAEAVMTAILTFTGCVASVDALCRWRGIELPRKK
ncbi:hypothetical protein ABT404_26255 [Streptomyces hyaluromycini]|uniref:Uncharacterized protein n=1 Tax=Streptomyces hyaluromycini TaxID=1377993 RepID=A0ABV1X1P2_9ACTN